VKVVHTQAGLRAMMGLGLVWSEVVRQVTNAPTQAPDPKFPGRRHYMTDQHVFFIAPEERDGELVLRVLGGYRRESAEVRARHLTGDLWAESRGPKQTRKGGRGSTLPTSYAEVLDRIKKTPGWDWRMGGKHIKVSGPAGELVTMPSTASDARALANTVHQLKRAGCDVRRAG